MYIARIRDKKLGSRYIIRQSYALDDCYCSRDLFDLGAQPDRFIVYPGGNGFYIDMAVEDAIAEQGVFVSQNELEPLFIPFLAPHIQRVIQGFDRKSRSGSGDVRRMPANKVHSFDRRRLQYLRFGRINPGKMGRTADRFYGVFQSKSRDEIEYDFIAAERILKARELANYVYHIFDLQQYFKENFARSHPEALNQEQMDGFFIEEVCRLNRDEFFWKGSEMESGLRDHLQRYVVMYFDSVFPTKDPVREYLQDFMNRHRIHRPPESVQVSLAESAILLGVSRNTLNKMGRRELTQQYRKQALIHHPDQGGEQQTFVKLTAAYRKLMKRKVVGQK